MVARVKSWEKLERHPQNSYRPEMATTNPNFRWLERHPRSNYRPEMLVASYSLVDRYLLVS